MTPSTTEDLSDLFMVVEPSSESSKRFDSITRALATVSNSELDRKALWAFMFAREKLTHTKRISDVLEWAQGWKEGQRGVLVSQSVRVELSA